MPHVILAVNIKYSKNWNQNHFEPGLLLSRIVYPVLRYHSRHSPLKSKILFNIIPGSTKFSKKKRIRITLHIPELLNLLSIKVSFIIRKFITQLVFCILKKFCNITTNFPTIIGYLSCKWKVRDTTYISGIFQTIYMVLEYREQIKSSPNTSKTKNHW